MSQPLRTPSEAITPEAGTRLVTCPNCGGDSLYAAGNPWRPFCCQRCKQNDLGAWASENYRMPEPPHPDGAPFDENPSASSG